jgi:hypothetical protein
MHAEAAGTSFQVWQLDDLSLIKTVVLEPGERGYEHRDPAEVRLLSDSVTAMMTTFTCALYRLHALDSEEPRAELVHVLPWSDYETDECGIPATYGDIWLQTYANSAGSSLISFDISDPSNPVLLDELEWGEPWWPHWISFEPGGRRIVLTSSTMEDEADLSEETLMGATRTKILLVDVDPETGEMSFDEIEPAGPTARPDPPNPMVLSFLDLAERPVRAGSLANKELLLSACELKGSSLRSLAH